MGKGLEDGKDSLMVYHPFTRSAENSASMSTCTGSWTTGMR